LKKAPDIVRLHVEQAGPPDGPTLLLLHALGSTGEDWVWQRDALTEAGYHLLMVDARGHGRSPKPHNRYRIEDMASDVARALDELSVARADVCGLSLGGAIALALALDYPERVNRLVIANAAAYFLTQSPSRYLYFGLRLVLMSLLSFRQQARLVASRVFPRPEHAEIREWFFERLAANDRLAYRRTFQALARFDVRERLGEISALTLVIAGADDTTVSLPQKEELAEAIPGARLEIVPDSGHGTVADCPEVFNRLVIDFLAKE
jgi:pimeloyl-ACP methyl ester carboxylesterase